MRVLNHLSGRNGLDIELTELTTVPSATCAMESASRTRDEQLGSNYDAVFLGALGDPRVPSNVHAKDILLGARFKLDLTNHRPCKLLDARYTAKRLRTEDIFCGFP